MVLGGEFFLPDHKLLPLSIEILLLIVDLLKLLSNLVVRLDPVLSDPLEQGSLTFPLPQTQWVNIIPTLLKQLRVVG